jgi:hypothetical protein
VFLQELEHVPCSLASYFREFTAMEYCFLTLKEPSHQLIGTTEEKVSFINNALRHVILGGNYSQKSFNLRLDILGGAEELRLS